VWLVVVDSVASGGRLPIRCLYFHHVGGSCLIGAGEAAVGMAAVEVMMPVAAVSS
jgi:hypothetical protein